MNLPRRRWDSTHNEEMWASHAVRWADGRRIPGIGRWIERVISSYIKQGFDPHAIELWVKVPKRGRKKGAK